MNTFREEQFITKNDIDKMTPVEQTILVTYFMFTTISTIGLGDYHPISNFERIVCTFLFVAGVTIFSVIMGNFIKIIDTFRTFNDDLDQDDELRKFFVVLAKFNYHGTVNVEF